jgi:fermentation-respiration switch protein FrsA (DUF1100 family)
MIFPKSILLLLACVALVIIVLALLVRLLENSITFHPTSNLELEPSDYGLDYRDVDFPPRLDSAPVVLLCHGNAGNISHRLEWAVPLVRKGWGLLMFDYRGYGHSTGSPDEQGLYSDAAAALEFLTEREKIAPGRIVLFGRSLGGAVATWLAARKQVGRLVLEGTFTSGAGMARSVFGLLPLHLAARYSWNNEKEIRNVTAPVLIIHGTADKVVPYVLGEKLYQSIAGRRDVRFRRVDGGDHLNLHLVIGQEYYDLIAEFVGDRK